MIAPISVDIVMSEGGVVDLAETHGFGPKKYQVFISSTYSDLKDERRAVTEIVLGMGHIPVGMELFEAGNEDQWTYIKDRIREVDYYLAIVAERYGSVGPAGISYTEMEYRFAREIGVPLAALLLEDSARNAWPAGKVDFDDRLKVNKFRTLCQERLVSFWSDSGSLTTRCQLALNGLFRNFPRNGWVRADQAITPELAGELARLSKENAALREQANKLTRISEWVAIKERSKERMRQTFYDQRSNFTD